MVHLPAVFAVALAAASVNGAPLTKRIAQVIADSTTKWEAACNKAGGGLQCNSVAVASFGTLLAAPGPCEQQDAADNMIDLGKTLNDDPDMIKFAQIFAQQPRNSPNSQSVPYCQQAPKNSELNGLFQCQYQGDDPNTFVGGGAPGSPGTVPLGLSSPVSPAGSCKANPSGPIKDGSQLTDIISDPGVSGNGASNTTSTAKGSSVSASSSGKKKGSSSATTTGSAEGSLASGTASGKSSKGVKGGDCSVGNDATTTTSTSSPTAQAAAAAASPSSSIIKLNNPSSDASATSSSPASATTILLKSGSGSASAAAALGTASSGGFQLQNGKVAQKLNAQFAKLTTSSSCSEGDQACVKSGFAQCVGGKFVVTQCAASTTCVALPLVNKPGTSIACTTESDALARIKATGATGGLTGA